MTESERIAAGRGQKPSLWLRMIIGRNPRVTLLRAAVLALLCTMLAKFVFLPVRVEGISMWPTYQDRSVNFINRLPYWWHEPRRGDVVGICLTPSGGLASPGVMYLKRIIGLPGETVQFVNGTVLIDSQVLTEPYEKGPCNWSYGPVKLGPDDYFVVGDNRTMRYQDHVFGKAHRKETRYRIVGKVIL